VQEPATTLLQQARAMALVLPRPWAYSHETAAGLLGLPLPSAWAPQHPLTSCGQATAHLCGEPVSTAIGAWSGVTLCS
jgi:hypothetical protein